MENNKNGLSAFIKSIWKWFANLFIIVLVSLVAIFSVDGVSRTGDVISMIEFKFIYREWIETIFAAIYIGLVISIFQNILAIIFNYLYIPLNFPIIRKEKLEGKTFR